MAVFERTSLLIPATFGSMLFPALQGSEMLAGDGSGRETGRPMNVLFFFVDDLRPNLGCYGDVNAVTPNIDLLARSGVTFNHAYCQQAVSNPSRTSLLTGLRPDENGVTDLETHFRDNVPDVITLPQLFRNNGYLTLGAGKVYHSTPFIVDKPSWTRPVPDYLPRAYMLPENLVENAKMSSFESADVADNAYPDGKTADFAIEYLQEASSENKPFFIAVGFTKPHLPFCAPSKYWKLYDSVSFVINDRYRPAGSPDLAFHNWEELRGYRDIPKSGPISSEKEELLWQGYYACISYIDAQVGRVLQTLDRLGLRENTVIVLWGDHGYHLGEQDLWGKSTNFELDARVPLIISSPGVKGSGNECNAIVETLDIYPTLADICGLTPQSKLSGISLRQLLVNPDKKWKNIAFNQFIRPYDALRNGKPTHMGYSVRTSDWRCTCWWDLKTGKMVEKELYYLKDYSVEKENLAGIKKYSKIETELTSRLTAYKDRQYTE
ncbi:MAG: sulfatase [Bacteroidales bacterium]|jgi:iduronate 2-sulfatase|nr:sulfatase [Bacteroidales bacterium]